MIMKIKKYNRIYIFVLILIGFIVASYFLSIDMNNLPRGEFLRKLDSPNKMYTLNAYFINGGSLSGDTIRVELVKNNNGKVKNIYYDYPKSNIDMEWINNDTVKLNNHILDIHDDTYNWRKDK